VAQSRGVTERAGLLAECDVRIDASPETVFGFFVDAEKMLLWKGVHAELDARPGGVFKVEVTPGWLAVGEFTEVDPPRLVAFTWGWEGGPVAPGSSLVRVTLEPDDGGTIVRLRHSGLPDEEMLEAHKGGWEHFLARLQIAATGGDPGPDPWATATPEQSGGAEGAQA
jgi:uncharacterized protein YndB with AHSA1/START domain